MPYNKIQQNHKYKKNKIDHYMIFIHRADNKAFIKPCSSVFGVWNLVWCRNLWLWTIRGAESR